MIDQTLWAKVASLSPADRLELVGAVWDTLPQGEMSVTEAEKKLLDARLADAEQHPDDESSWPEVKARLERALR